MLEISGAAHDFSLRVLAGPRISAGESGARRIKRSMTSRLLLDFAAQ
jgi:hypothetical protein